MITYPIDTKNTRWAFYNTQTNTVERENAKWPNRHGTEIVGQPEHIVPLLAVHTDPPAHDPATQKVAHDGWAIDVEANTYTQTWIVQPLTTEELAGRQQQKIAEIYAQRAAALEQLISPFSAIEARTWDVLEKQARAYLADGTIGDLIQRAIDRGRGADEYCLSVVGHADHMTLREQCIIGASEEMLTNLATVPDDPAAIAADFEARYQARLEASA